ncbi:IucA/IucC family C-terminal-domain containing protein [Dactylosporangium sp. NPDC005572]|uniref:IucA/IucC family C-terminal-domain containing protein n=1 Tax=Dactylosporangium sp. NPDC005572 TaxID=3156889 RepID=UPI0033BABC87
MTALISRGAHQPLAPVVATLTALQDRHGASSLQGLVPGLVALTPEPAGGWCSASDLKVTDLLAAAARRWQAQPHAAAALAWKCYSYWLALPAVLGFAGSRRVPLMTPDHVLVRVSDHQPFLTLALRSPVTAVLATDPIVATDAPGLLIVEDEEELLGVLRRSLVDAHLDPMLDDLRRHVHIGRRTLWGSVASGVAYGLSRAADSLPGPTLDIAHRLLTALDADELVDLSDRQGGGLDIQRRTCCLAFTLPTPKVCTTCCIRGH